MNIDNVKIYDMEESIIASGLPMIPGYDESEFAWQVDNLKYWLEHDILKIRDVLNRKMPSQENWAGVSGNGCVVCGKTPARAMKKFNKMRFCSAHAHQMERHGFIKAINRLSPNKIVLDDSGEFAWIILRDKNEDDVAKAKISCEDILKVCNMKFSLSKTTGYAHSAYNGLLHRVICDARMVDHVNRDRLDCRRENLRPATVNQNRRNRVKKSQCSCDVAGVSFCKERNNWRAYITLENKRIELGRFERMEDAIVCRLTAEVRYFQEFAPQNDIAKKYGIENPYIKNDADRKFNLGQALKHLARIERLSCSPMGSGHQNALSGFVVSLDVTGTNAWWLQMERYHFMQIVSMQSKMHRLKEMIHGEKDCFNGKTNFELSSQYCMIADTLESEEMVYSCPMGLELTARITTNYLQLKTIYHQRKNHKLQEWKDFCRWIEKLPLAKELIGVDSTGIVEGTMTR